MFCFPTANQNNVLQNASVDNSKVRLPANFYENRVTRSMLEDDLVFDIHIIQIQPATKDLKNPPLSHNVQEVQDTGTR